MTKAADLANGVGTSALNVVALDSSGKLPAVDASQLTGVSSGFSNMVVITTTGTWTVPTGVTKVKTTVVGGGGGNAGANTGGTSSFGAYSSATGGGTSGGSGTGGTLNLSGHSNSLSQSQSDVSGPTALSYLGATYGAGGKGITTSSVTGGVTTYTPHQSGGSGGTAIEYLSGLVPGTVITVTIGAAGASGTNGAAGTQGVVIIEY